MTNFNWSKMQGEASRKGVEVSGEDWPEELAYWGWKLAVY
jgi:hypothetical protein